MAKMTGTGIEKQRRKNMRKNEKGVTLIALAITIIILSIIAGVSISSLTNEKRYHKGNK